MQLLRNSRVGFNANIRCLAGLMMAVYFVMSVFHVGNYIVCFHEDGSVYVEIAKSKSSDDAQLDQVTTVKSDLANCSDDNCADREIGDPTLTSFGIQKLDADHAVIISPLSQTNAYLSLENLSHHSWRLSSPPIQSIQHYTSTVKPTISLQV